MEETRRTWTPRPVCRIYLKGDPAPIVCDLTVDALAYKLGEAEQFALNGDHISFIRVPFTDGSEGLVRPGAIAAILPATYNPDGD